MENEKAGGLLERLEQGYDLPSLSAVAVRLVETASDERSTASDLAAIIEKDPSLTVRLLRLANSAFFKGESVVTSLNQAVVKVGFQRLRIMALSLSLRETFPMGRRDGLDYERFWRTSFYRALLARSLAVRTTLCNPEEAFVASLTLEIGILVFHDLLSRKAQADAFPEDPENLEEALPLEWKAYGVDHRRVGEAALRFWRFPDALVACQSAYGDAALNEERPGIVRISELSRQLALDVVRESHDVCALFERAYRVLGLDADSMGEILVSTFDYVEEIAQSLRLEMDKERDLLELMERANCALGDISKDMDWMREAIDRRELPTLDTVEQGGDSTRTLEAVAHEIRNPLTAVGGFARRLADVLDPSSQGGRYARVILQEAARLEEALSRVSRRIDSPDSST
ncbi:MAG: HDOD domain-containing protein [Desulfobacteraceae bacterium]|jgi:HD-like signal output (HDOD) protein